METHVRAVQLDEIDAADQVFLTALAMRGTPERQARVRRGFVPGRTLAAFEDGRIVGAASALAFHLTVPGGGRVAAAGVSRVGVLATHRRRGILTRLMTRLLSGARDRGEPVAILHATEGGIYGRFGFGVATLGAAYAIDTHRAALLHAPEPTGRLSLIPWDDATRQRLVPVYDRASRWPGAITRDPTFWDAWFGPDAPPEDTPRFVVVHTGADGTDDGFACYQATRRPDELAAVVQVSDLVGASPATEASLWRHVLNLDLVTSVTSRRDRVDHPLRWWLADPRALRTTALEDELWLRILDVPAALAARSYTAAARVVLDVTDRFRPEDAGRVELDATPEGATCRRTSATADVGLDIADLAILYLGAATATELAVSGRLRAPDLAALQRLDALFATRRAPWCGTFF